MWLNNLDLAIKLNNIFLIQLK